MHSTDTVTLKSSSLNGILFNLISVHKEASVLMNMLKEKKNSLCQSEKIVHKIPFDSITKKEQIKEISVKSDKVEFIFTHITNSSEENTIKFVLLGNANEELKTINADTSYVHCQPQIDSPTYKYTLKAQIRGTPTFPEDANVSICSHYKFDSWHKLVSELRFIACKTAQKLYCNRKIDTSDFKEYLNSKLFSGGLMRSIITQDNPKLNEKLKIVCEEYGIEDQSEGKIGDEQLHCSLIEKSNASIEKTIECLYEASVNNQSKKMYKGSRIEGIVRIAFYTMLRATNKIDDFKVLSTLTEATQNSSENIRLLKERDAETFEYVSKLWTTALQIIPYFSGQTSKLISIDSTDEERKKINDGLINDLTLKAKLLLKINRPSIFREEINKGTSTTSNEQDDFMYKGITAFITSNIDIKKFEHTLENCYREGVLKIIAIKAFVLIIEQCISVSEALLVMSWFKCCLFDSQTNTYHYMGSSVSSGDNLKLELRKQFFVFISKCVEFLQKAKKESQIKTILELFKWKYTALDHESIQISGLIKGLKGAKGTMLNNLWGKPLFSKKHEPTLSSYLLCTFEYIFHSFVTRIMKGSVANEVQQDSTTLIRFSSRIDSQYSMLLIEELLEVILGELGQAYQSYNNFKGISSQDLKKLKEKYQYTAKVEENKKENDSDEEERSRDFADSGDAESRRSSPESESERPSSSDSRHERRGRRPRGRRSSLSRSRSRSENSHSDNEEEKEENKKEEEKEESKEKSPKESEESDKEDKATLENQIYDTEFCTRLLKMAYLACKLNSKMPTIHLKIDNDKIKDIMSMASISSHYQKQLCYSILEAMYNINPVAVNNACSNTTSIPLLEKNQFIAYLISECIKIRQKCFIKNKQKEKGEYQIAQCMIRILYRMSQKYKEAFIPLFEDVIISPAPKINDVLLIDIILSLAGGEFNSINKGSQILYNSFPVTIIGYAHEVRLEKTTKESSNKCSHLYVFEKENDLEVKCISLNAVKGFVEKLPNPVIKDIISKNEKSIVDTLMRLISLEEYQSPIQLMIICKYLKLVLSHCDDKFIISHLNDEKFISSLYKFINIPIFSEKYPSIDIDMVNVEHILDFCCHKDICVLPSYTKTIACDSKHTIVQIGFDMFICNSICYNIKEGENYNLATLDCLTAPSIVLTNITGGIKAWKSLLKRPNVLGVLTYGNIGKREKLKKPIISVSKQEYEDLIKAMKTNSFQLSPNLIFSKIEQIAQFKGCSVEDVKNQMEFNFSIEDLLENKNKPNESAKDINIINIIEELLKNSSFKNIWTDKLSFLKTSDCYGNKFTSALSFAVTPLSLKAVDITQNLMSSLSRIYIRLLRKLYTPLSSVAQKDTNYEWMINNLLHSEYINKVTTKNSKAFDQLKKQITGEGTNTYIIKKLEMMCKTSEIKQSYYCHEVKSIQNISIPMAFSVIKSQPREFLIANTDIIQIVLCIFLKSTDTDIRMKCLKLLKWISITNDLDTIALLLNNKGIYKLIATLEQQKISGQNELHSSYKSLIYNLYLLYVKTSIITTYMFPQAFIEARYAMEMMKEFPKFRSLIQKIWMEEHTDVQKLYPLQIETTHPHSNIPCIANASVDFVSEYCIGDDSKITTESNLMTIESSCSKQSISSKIDAKSYTSDRIQIKFPHKGTAVYALGNADKCQLGVNKSIVETPYKIEQLNDMRIKNIIICMGATYALTQENELYICGEKNMVQSNKVFTFNKKIDLVAATDESIFFIDGRSYSFKGKNEDNQMPINSTNMSSIKNKTTTDPVFIDLSICSTHTLAVTADGNLYANPYSKSELFGKDYVKPEGEYELSKVVLPAHLKVKRAFSIISGSIILVYNTQSKLSELYSIGKKSSILGIGEIEPKEYTQIKLDGTSVEVVSVAAQHAAAITSSNKFFIWGTDKHTQANEKKGEIWEPIIVDYFKSKVVKDVSCGTENIIVIAEDGVYSIGNHKLPTCKTQIDKIEAFKDLKPIKAFCGPRCTLIYCGNEKDIEVNKLQCSIAQRKMQSEPVFFTENSIHSYMAYLKGMAVPAVCFTTWNYSQSLKIPFIPEIDPAPVITKPACGSCYNVIEMGCYYLIPVCGTALTLCFSCYVQRRLGTLTPTLFICTNKPIKPFPASQYFNDNSSFYGVKLVITPVHKLKIPTQHVINGKVVLADLYKDYEDIDIATNLENKDIKEYIDSYMIDENILIKDIKYDDIPLPKKYLKAKDNAKSAVRKRIKLIAEFSKSIVNAFGFIDFCSMSENSMSDIEKTYIGVKEYVLYASKIEIIDNEIGKIHRNSSSPSFTFNRAKAHNIQLEKKLDIKGERTFFCQLYQLCKSDKTIFTCDGRAFNVQYKGEPGTDAGGLYRDFLDNISRELMGPCLRLLKRTPNNVSNVGQFREKYILNADANTVQEMELFRFLGWLIGMTIASDNILTINMSHFSWKQILGDPIELNDINGIDYYSYKEVNRMISYSKKPEEFDATFEEYFVRKKQDGTTTELITSGSKKRITTQNLQEYIELFVQSYRDEAKNQITMIKKGIYDIVPKSCIMKLSAEDLDNKVCGRPKITVEQLKKITNYEGYSETDTVVQNFWKVFEEFSNDERSLYLKFVWGRSRLPVLKADMSSDDYHKLHKCSKSDDGLPEAHTCFFQLDLPSYSTIDIMRAKLLYAIQSCTTFEMS